jgi:adenylate kinase family enzyme
LDNKYIKKIAIIGNAAGGKTLLSRRLASIYNLPLSHIDSIQFLPGLKIRPYQESIDIIRNIMLDDKWIIDGYGPLDILQLRIDSSDKIIFIDLPLWRHYWWFLKRQIKIFFKKRQELPEDCNELSLAHTLKVINNIWKVHYQMRPEMIKILSDDKVNFKVIHITSLSTWNKVYQDGVFK